MVHTTRLFALLFAMSCLFLGCASVVDDEEKNSGQQDEKDSDDGKSSDDEKDSDDDSEIDTSELGQIDYCTGDECKEEEEFQKTGACPQWEYVACDGNIRKYCGDDGYIAKETCPDACENGKCVSFGNNSCENPYIVKVGGSATGTTLSGAEFTKDQTSCAGKLKTMKAVFKVTIDEAGFYQFTSSNPEGTNWGNILTPKCELANEISSLCDTSNSTDTFYTLLTPGDYYFFVAPATLLAANFDAELSVRKAKYDETNLCGSGVGSFELVELKDGQYKTTGNTSSGSSSKTYENFGCNAGSGGKEVAYMLSAKKGQKVTASVEIKSTENLPDSIAVYIEHCNNNTAIMKRCADTKAAAGKISTTYEIAQTGEYLIYIDSNTSNKDFDYELTITVK